MESIVNTLPAITQTHTEHNTQPNKDRQTRLEQVRSRTREKDKQTDPHTDTQRLIDRYKETDTQTDTQTDGHTQTEVHRTIKRGSRADTDRQGQTT